MKLHQVVARVIACVVVQKIKNNLNAVAVSMKMRAAKIVALRDKP